MPILSEINLNDTLFYKGYLHGVDYDLDQSNIPQNILSSGIIFGTNIESIDYLLWFNQNDPKPTEQEIISFEDERIAEEVDNEQDVLEINQSMLSLPIDKKMIKVIAGINEDVQKRFLDGTPTTIDQMIAGLENRLIGSPIQGATVSYIETVTSETYATLKLTPLGKEKIWNYATQFMNNIITTWDARGQR